MFGYKLVKQSELDKMQVEHKWLIAEVKKLLWSIVNQSEKVYIRNLMKACYPGRDGEQIEKMIKEFMNKINGRR